MKISSLQSDEGNNVEKEGKSSEEIEDPEKVGDTASEDTDEEGKKKAKNKKNSLKVTKSRKKKRATDRHWNKWTTPQKNIVMKHLSGEIEAEVIPGKDKCSKVIRETLCKGRPWQHVKNFCRNEIKRRLRLTADS